VNVVLWRTTDLTVTPVLADDEPDSPCNNPQPCNDMQPNKNDMQERGLEYGLGCENCPEPHIMLMHQIRLQKIKMYR
jgi:hypothetical protein